MGNERVNKKVQHRENTKDIMNIRLHLQEVKMNHRMDVNEIKSGSKLTPNNQITKISASEARC